MKRALAGHAALWGVSTLVLTAIYGTAFGSYRLGFVVVLMLLPVHMVYFYSIVYWVIPRFFFRRRYVITALACLLIALLVAVLYRLNEMLLSDPYIFRFYKITDPAFSWGKLSGSFMTQLFRPTDFVNAVERSNVIVWIGVSLKFVQLWYERQQAALQAELNFLKAQIHPHFLFNTLNNLYALARSQSKQTPEVILGLSQILRYMLYECNAEMVLLKRDVEILENYIALEKIRYEDRLELNFHRSGKVASQQIAPLLMLPLVENAFKHGVSETIDAPWINIELTMSETRLVLKVSNSKPETTDTDAGTMEKVGLSNVRKRLELLYPANYQLEFCDDEGLYIVTLELDLVKPINLN
jgi:hypothetical protein